jgi:hypothetical protein
MVVRLRCATALLLLWVGLVPLDGAGQDRAALGAALDELRQAVLETPGKTRYELRDLVWAYRSIGDLDNARRLMPAYEAAAITAPRVDPEWRTSLDVLASDYVAVGDREASARLALLIPTHAPTSLPSPPRRLPWADISKRP